MVTPMNRSEITETPLDGSPVPARLVHDVPEIAVLLGGVTERYVWKLIATGELPSFLLGKRRVAAREDLDAFIRKLREDELKARAAASAA